MGGLIAGASGQELDSFNPSTDAEVFSVTAQPDGKVLVGGNFSSIAGVARRYFARLNQDGSLDAAFNPLASAGVSASVVLPDGKILIGGEFQSVGGTTHIRVARLNPDGSVDPSFSGGVDAHVSALLVQPDGRLLIGGTFTRVGNGSRTGIARLLSDGSLDTSFNSDLLPLSTTDSVDVQGIALQADGRILIGGNFSQVGGRSQVGLARLHPDGARL